MPSSPGAAGAGQLNFELSGPQGEGLGAHRVIGSVGLAQPPDAAEATGIDEAQLKGISSTPLTVDRLPFHFRNPIYSVIEKWIVSQGGLAVILVRTCNTSALPFLPLTPYTLFAHDRLLLQTYARFSVWSLERSRLSFRLKFRQNAC